jgi:thioredoxin-like negative regulator of GroEL
MTKRYYGRVIIAKLDTSRNQLTSGQYRIRGVPTLIFFKNGQVMDQITGALPEQELIRLLDRFA